MLRLSWLAQQHYATLGGGHGTTRRFTHSPWLKRLVALSWGDVDYGIRMVSNPETTEERPVWFVGATFGGTDDQTDDITQIANTYNAWRSSGSDDYEDVPGFGRD